MLGDKVNKKLTWLLFLYLVICMVAYAHGMQHSENRICSDGNSEFWKSDYMKLKCQVADHSLAEFQVAIDEQLGRKKSVRLSTPVTIELKEISVRGPREAPITLIEFSDFECPFCARVSPTIHQLVKQYPGQVKWVFREY